MDVYWSVEECRWVPCPVVERPADEVAVPVPREADETVPVPEPSAQS
jgi:hypothetical protein